MIQLPERYFGYTLIQCADEERSEVLNVGVLVFDGERHAIECRTVQSLDRVERTLPNVPVAHVRLVLDHARDSAEELLDTRGVEGIQVLHSETHGSIRFTPVRSILGGRIERTAEDLLQRYVELPHRIGHPMAAVRADEAPGSQFSSRRVINSVETRLRRFKLEKGKDYETDVTILAPTDSKLKLPVWFPLRIRDDIFLDGVDVKADQNRTLDSARAILQKVVEAHRAKPQARMSVIIRDPEKGESGDMAEAVLGDSKTAKEGVLTVERYSALSELDEVVHHTLEPEHARG